MTRSASYTYLGMAGSATAAGAPCEASGSYPYLSRRAMFAGRLSSRGSTGTAHSTSGADERRLRCNAERVKADVSGRRFELELAERVVDALADLARDGQPRDGGVAARSGRSVDGDVGSALPVRVHGRLNE